MHALIQHIESHQYPILISTYHYYLFNRMIPQLERKTAEDGQVEPPGFQLVTLPFADDMRQVSDKFFNRQYANETQVSAAEDLIESCRIPPFNATLFNNPQIAKFYSCLQALALNKNEVEWNEEEDDLVYGDEAGMAEVAAAPAEAFGLTLPAESLQIEDKKKSTNKRKRNNDQLDPEHIKQMRFDLKQMRDAGTLGQQTVPRLRALCKSQGLPTSGKKADLIERINDALDSKQ